MKPNYPLNIAGLPPAALQALQQIRTILSGGGTLKDNAFAALVELPFVHGQPIERPSPLRGGSIPIGFEVISAWDDDGNAIPFPRPEFDENFEDSREYRLTLYAAPPVGAISVARDSEQVVADDTSPAVQFESEEYRLGSKMSWSASSNTRITFAAAGRVSVGYQALFDSAANGRRLARVAKSSSSEWYAVADIPGGSFAGLNGSDEIDVSAGEYIELIVYQNSGGNLSVLASGNQRAALRARYVDAPADFSGTVLGIMWGG